LFVLTTPIGCSVDVVEHQKHAPFWCINQSVTIKGLCWTVEEILPVWWFAPKAMTGSLFKLVVD